MKTRGRGEFCLLAGIFVMLGCPVHEGSCDQERPCGEGRHCVGQNEVGVCVWGKEDPHNPGQTVPDVRLENVVETFGPNQRTNNAHIEMQMNVYGASAGVDIWLQAPGSERQPFWCEELKVEAQGNHRQLKCSPQPLANGSYFLEVEAHGVEGNTIEHFSWVYDTTPPQLRSEVEVEKGKNSWGRDEILYVQLQNEDADIHWEKTELVVDGQNSKTSAALTECPQRLQDKPNAQCFKILLSNVRNLPHGEHELTLKATAVDEAGNTKESKHTLPLYIERVLWTQNLATAELIETSTKDGWTFIQLSSTQIAAYNSKGQQVWTSTASGFEWPTEGDFLLGNHKGTQVLLKTCTTMDGVGLHALHVETGLPLVKGCSILKGTDSSFALLQGGPTQELLVVRKFSIGEDQYLETYQFLEEEDRLSCGESTSLIAYGMLAAVVVQPQSPQNALVYSSAIRSAWFSYQHQWNNTSVWGSSDSSVQTNNLKSIFGIGSQVLWGLDWVSPLGGTSVRQILTEGITPWAIDKDNALIASDREGYIHRYNTDAISSSQSTEAWFPQALFLIEGGDILLVDHSGSVVVLNSNFEVRWQEDFLEAKTHTLRKALLIPSSSTRSMLVLEIESNASRTFYSFLIDSPGLDKEAPWPTRGHDLCRSFNSAVPIDACWNGPKL
ncbi:MAG: hypothetical protein FWG75_07685 [Cystobacterineae bacterium]|nr:hypothetical protein [Cystobacterineae bacterium]